MEIPRFFASQNKSKLAEINHILGIDLELIHLDLLEPQALNVEEVVVIKAKDGYQQAGKPVLVEDTGLYIKAWNGLPGALVKWFLDTVGNKGILAMLGNTENRNAIVKSAVAFCDESGCHVFIGEMSGTIVSKITGDSVFGWDPLFIPKGHLKTFAQMTLQEKSTISMRKIALEKLKQYVPKK